MLLSIVFSYSLNRFVLRKGTGNVNSSGFLFLFFTILIPFVSSNAIVTLGKLPELGCSLFYWNWINPLTLTLATL